MGRIPPQNRERKIPLIPDGNSLEPRTREKKGRKCSVDHRLTFVFLKLDRWHVASSRTSRADKNVQMLGRQRGREEKVSQRDNMRPLL